MSSDEGITAFLAARLDEDEVLIRRNSGDHGLAHGFPDYRTYDGPEQNAADEYIDRFGPVRLLREVEAMRAVLAEHRHVAADTPDFRKGPEPFGCFTCDYVPDEGTYGGGWCTTIRILAVIWSDHPGYDQNWKPEEITA